MALTFNQTKALQFFQSKGYSPQAASGVVAGLSGENLNGNYTARSYQPTENGGAINPQGAFGIAQWNGSRQADLAHYAATTGGNVNNLDTQLGFVDHELQTNYGSTYDAVKSAPTSGAALSSFVSGYEVPKDIPGQIQSRSGFLSSTDAYTAQNGAGQAGDIPTFNQPNTFGNTQGKDGNYGSIGGDGTPAFASPNMGAQQSPDTSTGSQFDTISNAPPGGSSGYNVTSADPSESGPTNPDGSFTLSEMTATPNSVAGPNGSVSYQTDPIAPAGVTPGTLDTTKASSTSGSGAYGGDMFVPQALDTVARSISDSTTAANKTQTSSAQTVAGSLNNVGTQVSDAGKTTAAATTGLSQQVGSSTNSLLAGAQSLLTQGMSFGSDWFVRAFIIILGLIFVGVGLSMFKTVQTNVIQPVAGAAKRGAKLATRVAA